MNEDFENEKRIHPENFKQDNMEEASELIEFIQTAVTDLDYFSVRNGDVFNGQIGKMEEELRNCRKQII